MIRMRSYVHSTTDTLAYKHSIIVRHTCMAKESEHERNRNVLDL